SRRRLDDPGEQSEERRLAGPVAPDEPDRAPRLDGEGDVAQRPDVGAAGPSPRDDEILERAALARVDAEAARGMLDVDLAGSHGRALVTMAASVRTNAGSAFGISIRSSRIPSAAAFSCASTSRSQRISRWSETKPTGQTSTWSTPSACRAERWSRMSGPSHGS